MVKNLREMIVKNLCKNTNLLHISIWTALAVAVLSLLFIGRVNPVRAASYKDTIQAEPTLLNYWPMDESSGTTLNAAVGGNAINLTGATPGASGQVDGSAVQFNGTNNYGVTASNLNFTGRNKLVVEALMYVDSYTDSIRLGWEFSPSTITNQGGFYYAQDVGAVSEATVKGNTGLNVADYSRPTAGRWHMYTVVYNMGSATNEVELYIDGALQAVTTRPFTNNNTSNFGNYQLYLMSRNGSSFFGNGKMQHLAIYSDLTDSQMISHAQAAGVNKLLSDDVTTTHDSATLTWQNLAIGAPPITAQLQRSPHSINSWSNVNGATSSPYTDTGLSALTSYDYRVVYTDNNSQITYSNIINTTTLKRYPPFIANSTTVMTGPYDTAKSTVGTDWTPGGAGSLEWLTDGHQYRIRQDGPITRVRLFTPLSTQITGLYIKIWRKNGSTYDLVGTSNNLASQLVNNDFATIDLGTPINGVKAGDFYGARVETSGSNGKFYAYNPGNVSMKFILNQTAQNSAMDWTNKSNTNYVMPVELYTNPAPQAVFIGDSIIQGVPNNYSFLDPTNTTNLAASIEGKFKALTGYTYQNMGKGSDTTTIIKNRFTNDVINLHPRVAIIEGGVNDIHSSQSKSQFISNWTTMLEAAQASSSISKILVVKILPWTNGTTVQNQTRDDWNASLVNLAANYSKATIVDASSAVGQFRSGGDSGNLWDIQPAYSADGVHFTESGNARIAEVIANALDTTSPTTTDNTDSSWHNGPVTVTLTCSDGESGCANTYYTTDGSTPTTSSSQGTSVVLNSDGQHVIKYFSVDSLGNQEAVKTAPDPVKIDTTPPSVPSSLTTPSPTQDTTPTWSWSASIDNDSGLADPAYEVEWSQDNTFNTGVLTDTTNNTSFEQPSTLADGTWYFRLRATDLIDNHSNYSSIGTVIIDSTPPVVSGINVIAVNTTTASITWSTNENTDSYIEYGVSTSYGANSAMSSSAISHSASLTGLTPGTTYHYRIVSTDLATNQSTSSDQTFLTEADTPQPPQDTDSDGIPDSTENAGPNNGDANNDNVQDSTQANVVTLSNVVTNSATVLELGSGCSVQSAATEPESAQSSDDSNFGYPNALVNFTADCGAPGVTTTVRLYYYDVSNKNFVLRKYNPNTITYSTIDDASIAQQVIDSRVVTIASYSITDGGELDVDNQEDGTIVDPVGLAEEQDTPKNPIASALANTGQVLYSPVVAGVILITSGTAVAIYNRRKSTLKK